MIYTHVAKGPAPQCESPLDLLRIEEQVSEKIIQLASEKPRSILTPPVETIDLALEDSATHSEQQADQNSSQITTIGSPEDTNCNYAPELGSNISLSSNQVRTPSLRFSLIQKLGNWIFKDRKHWPSNKETKYGIR